MSDQSATATPPRSGSPVRKVAAWLKKNKLLAGGAGLGGAFLLLSRSGGSTTPEEQQFGQIVPVMRPLSEDEDFVGDDWPNGGEPPIGEEPPDTPEPIDQPEPLDPVDDPEPAPAPITPPAALAPAGHTVLGRFFANATGSRRDRDSADSRGSFMQWVITYPGRAEWWRFYQSGSASGQWAGPYTSGFTPPPPKPAQVAAPPRSAPATSPTPPGKQKVGTVQPGKTTAGIPGAIAIPRGGPVVAPPPPPRRIVRTGRQSYNGESNNCRTRQVFQWSDGDLTYGPSHVVHKGKCHDAGIKW